MTQQVQVQLVWHLHQPYYGLPTKPINYLPWVRLHAIRSYYDLAAALEQNPEIRATVNFSGSLLRQLREYVEEGRRDSWWDLTLKQASHLDGQDRRHLVRHFFSVDPGVVEMFPRFRELRDKRGADGRDTSLDALTTQDYRDLQVWFNLAWFGAAALEERPILAELIEKGRGFSEGEKEALLEQQLDVMQLVVPRFRDLHRRGQIELSVSPMYHPILPLLVDTGVGRHETSDVPLPDPELRAPEDAAEQVWMARSISRDFLGVDVSGMWPAEGAVSQETMRIFEGNELSWVCANESVLRASRADAWSRDSDLYRPWSAGGATPILFFGDRELADHVTGASRESSPEVAARDFVARVAASDGPVVTVVFDRHRPGTGAPTRDRPFLQALFSELAACELVRTTTPTAYLDEFGCDDSLTALKPGFVGGEVSARWVGGVATNKAWEYLALTRRDLLAHLEDAQVDEDAEDAAWEALYVAQGSDWFGWYADGGDTEDDNDFDRLFRDQLRFVYNSVLLDAPLFLDDPVVRSSVAPPLFEAPTRLISPRIDGATEFFYEWEGAGLYRNSRSGGAMYDSARLVDRLFIGFDLDALFVRADYGADLRKMGTALVVRIYVHHSRGEFLIQATSRGGGSGWVEWLDDGSRVVLEQVAFGSSIEIGVPFADLELDANDPFRVWFTFAEQHLELERHPVDGGLDLKVPDRSFELRNWIV